jgi:biopolymer transport protein ExbD
MTIKRIHKRKEPEIPVSSFADIAFLLIIFFILATTLVQLTGMVSEIPSGKKAEKKEEKTNRVQLMPGDKIRFNEHYTDTAGLRKRLKDLNLKNKAGPDRIVQLEAVGNVTYQTYFEVMTAISAAGGVTVIVTEEDE